MSSLKFTRRQFLQQSLAAPLILRYSLSQAAEPLVQFIWSGAVTPTSVIIKTKLTKDSPTVRLAVSPTPDFSQPFYTDPQPATLTINNRVVAFSLANLTPDTRYYYAVEVDGQLDTRLRGQFKTFPSGPASFMIAFASCAETGSAHPIFETIRNLNPLFFIHTGDLHYLDIPTNDRDLFRNAFETVLASPTQSSLYRSTPLVYIWDDHDYGPNDSTALSGSRTAARLTYQEYVPHYPLAAGSGDVPIYHAFSVGRVRFIVTDLRSERSPKLADDNANKSMLGLAQKAWFKEELLRANTDHVLTIWVSSVDWLADLSDGWYLYSTERRELADFIKTNNINKLAMIAGDLHMLGIDNGSHNTFATGGGSGFPIFQASPLDRFGFDADAPYSEGRVAQRGQFGIMNVIDDGGPTVRVEWSGRSWTNEELLAYSFTV
ncbi:MAG: alkaline phosphatase D family protein [Anaerolineaceae bacterium]|nr:alkaline phosphatase D family protein [Anaerolineaceae bacterium]